MKDSKTYCFGRFLIDLPKAAEVNGQAYEFMFGKIEVERFLKGAEAFAQKMKEREADLRAGKHEDKFKLVDVRSTRLPNAQIFKITKKLIGAGGDSFGFEAYLFNGRVLFSMKETAYDEDKIDSVLQRLETRLLPNLRQRSPDKIPTEPGFCIENGFIADDGKVAQYEKAGISFKFRQWPDVTVYVYSRTNGDKVEEPLLTRRAKTVVPAELIEAEKGIRVLRKGERKIGAHNGEELLETYSSGTGFSVHQFVWDVRGSARSWSDPVLVFEFETGVNPGNGPRMIRPSLTDKQAIELFDAIVNSIRLRPTTPGKTSAADPDPTNDDGTAKRLPLGTKVSSLRACPETGVYQCPSDTPGVAERRLFIEQGRPMPAAFIAQSKRGITGLFGGQESKEVETFWTLVAYGRGTS